MLKERQMVSVTHLILKKCSVLDFLRVVWRGGLVLRDTHKSLQGSWTQGRRRQPLGIRHEIREAFHS